MNIGVKQGGNILNMGSRCCTTGEVWTL